MTKNEFLTVLGSRLSGLPEADKARSLDYYSEMIDDRMDDGLSEEEAVEAIGTMDEIVREILTDVPLTKIVKGRVLPKRSMKVWEIALIVLGAPLWLSVALAAVALVLSAYAALWSVVLTAYAGTLALGVGSLAGVVGTVLLAARGELAGGLLLLGGGLICAGLTVLAFYVSGIIANIVVIIGKLMILGVKRLFMGKEAA